MLEICSNDKMSVNSDFRFAVYEKAVLIVVKSIFLKFTDGILMVSAYSYNAVVKTDLEGNELWKITTGREAYSASVQLLKNNYVIQKGDVDDFGFPSGYMTTVVTPDGNMVVNKTEF